MKILNFFELQLLFNKMFKSSSVIKRLIIFAIIQGLVSGLTFFLDYQPGIKSKYIKIYKEKIINKPIKNTKTDNSNIFLVYHEGSSYIDPVDPKGERCLIPWDYTHDITKAKLIMYNVLDNYHQLSSPRDSRLRPDQVTCMESMESETNYDALRNNRGSFNYTMYYSLTSDVPIPYAEYFESSEMPLDLSEKKGRLAAAFISNCGAANGRTEYVKELMKYMKIDSYGGCVNNANVPSEWEKGERDRTKENVLSHYKFTLAFENSDDDDYITEKLYQPLRYGSVPIFRGCKNVEDFAPPHSVIDANKFASAKELADYINYLDSNDDEYNKYLEWKKTKDLGNLAKVRFFRDRTEYGVCALIERMHGLWINPFLTDWKRVTNSSLGCNKCTEDFDLSLRRKPKLRSDGWTYEYPVPRNVEHIIQKAKGNQNDQTENKEKTEEPVEVLYSNKYAIETQKHRKPAIEKILSIIPHLI